MKSELNHLKGIHPGLVLERELEKRQLRKGVFALTLQEYPQTLTAITKGKRGMNTALSLKIERALGLEEGFFMILQVYYDIGEEKRKQNNKLINLPQLRPVLFWDTKMESIDWEKQKKAIIKRVFERGNEKEKNEVIRFYGSKTIDEILNNSSQNAVL
ncbi:MULTISPECIES: helix-turn-helix transcriptional regulator [unclassified Flavobacterium]|jgi:plasmid maintenance system antidote protein VapI|uniref:helix-turn-helix transcriptional regulator n=1 Tax=unclassified Flavobacterium TaxID=196869 RepID=UPI0025BA7A72|nr:MULTISPECIES: plasmid maintenance system antidote protein [unclassified Flavobacterium]